MAMYAFVPPFREAKFSGVSCVFDKFGCSAGEKKVVKHWFAQASASKS
jgi:hypothetical protein